MADGDFIPIPQSHYSGAIVVNVFAILSTAALVFVVLRVFWLALAKLRKFHIADSRECVFFHTQLGQYAACLLIGNLMTSIAGLMGLPWLLRKGITDGVMCRSQAFVMQVGNWGSAYFTVAIGVHTFNSLVLKKRQSILISLPSIIIGWAIAATAAAVPFALRESEGNTYGPAGLSCGARDIFPKSQFIFHLLPIFLASLLAAFLYSFIFLVLRGTLMIKGGIKLTLDPNSRWDGANEDYHKFVARVARSMLWYPIAYIALLIPYSVMRLLVISGFSIAWEAMVFAFVCWFLLGAVNVLLLYNTFRVLGPAFDGRSAYNESRKTMESFGPTGYFLEQATPNDQDQKSVLLAQIDQYRFPVPSYQPSSVYEDRSSSRLSDRSLLPAYHEHERNASDGSVQSSLGRPITPVDQLQKMLAVPPPALDRSPVIGSPKSQVSLHTAMRSLPAPPRRGPSPSISSVASNPTTRPHSPPAAPDGVWTFVTPPVQSRPPIRTPSATFGQQWATHGVSQSWESPKFSNNALSGANTPRSSPPTRPLLLSSSPGTSPYSQNMGLPSPSPRQRPLLLSRNDSTTFGVSRPPPTPLPRSF